MANILNRFFTDLEAVERRSRKLKLQNIDALFESTKFEKIKGSNIVKYVQNNYFSYIDKVVSLRRNFLKASVILAYSFYYCFRYYFY